MKSICSHLPQMGCFTLFIALFIACQSGEFQKVETPSVPMDSSAFAVITGLPLLEDDAIDEASGLIAHSTQDKLFWTHNDSGDEARIFLIDTEGKTRLTAYLEGIEARDWEEIARSTADSISYLWVAEIGDNQAQYAEKYLYRFPEPLLEEGTTEITIPSEQIETITFQYPAQARDAETLFVDPQTQDIYLISKREEKSIVFSLAFPYSTEKMNTLKKHGTLPFRNTVAGDITASGNQILLKTYDEVFLWQRDSTEHIHELLSTQPTRLPYSSEPQGEAIAWGNDENSFYTLSEERNGTPTRLYEHKSK